MQLARLLLSHGADVELRDEYGKTVLHSVAEWGRSGDIVKVLLENKLDINARDEKGQTALLIAVRCSPDEPKEHRSLITQLLEGGASVDQSDIDGWTALHWAAAHGVVEIACQLLEAGADINARDRNGDTAADCLIQWYDWRYMTKETRAECEDIFERYSFYQCGKKSSGSDSGDISC